MGAPAFPDGRDTQDKPGIDLCNFPAILSLMSIAPSRTIRLLVVALILISTAGCDQMTKHLARKQLNSVESTPLAGGLVEFVLAENPGAFLSLGASLPEGLRGGLFTAGISLGLVALLIYLLRVEAIPWSSFFWLVLIWAGGMSNLVDRFFRHGLVTDFMIIRIGPLHTGVFNVADLAIVTGTIFLLLSLRGRPTKSVAP
jgi:signal peptidase II